MNVETNRTYSLHGNVFQVPRWKPNYHLSKERNAIIFQGVAHGAFMVFDAIVKDFRRCIHFWRHVKHTGQNRLLCLKFKSSQPRFCHLCNGVWLGSVVSC